MQANQAENALRSKVAERVRARALKARLEAKLADRGGDAQSILDGLTASARENPVGSMGMVGGAPAGRPVQRDPGGITITDRDRQPTNPLDDPLWEPTVAPVSDEEAAGYQTVLEAARGEPVGLEEARGYLQRMRASQARTTQLADEAEKRAFHVEQPDEDRGRYLDAANDLRRTLGPQWSSGEGGQRTDMDPALERIARGFGTGLVRDPARMLAEGVAGVADLVPGGEGVAGEARAFSEEVAREDALRMQGGILEGLGRTGGNVVPSGAVVVGGAPAAGAAVLSYYGAQGFGAGVQQYREWAQSNGIEPDPEAAVGVGVAYGAVEVLSEKIGLDLLGRVAGPMLRRVTDAVFTKNAKQLAGALVDAGVATQIEGGEEAVTQLAQNAIDQLYDSERGIMDGVKQAYQTGVIGGGLIAGGVAARGGVEAARRGGTLRARLEERAQRRARSRTQEAANVEEGPQAEEAPDGAAEEGEAPDDPGVLVRRADREDRGRAEPDRAEPEEAAPERAAKEVAEAPDADAEALDPEAVSTGDERGPEDDRLDDSQRGDAVRDDAAVDETGVREAEAEPDVAGEQAQTLDEMAEEDTRRRAELEPRPNPEVGERVKIAYGGYFDNPSKSSYSRLDVVEAEVIANHSQKVIVRHTNEDGSTWVQGLDRENLYASGEATEITDARVPDEGRAGEVVPALEDGDQRPQAEDQDGQPSQVPPSEVREEAPSEDEPVDVPRGAPSSADDYLRVARARGDFQITPDNKAMAEKAVVDYTSNTSFETAYALPQIAYTGGEPMFSVVYFGDPSGRPREIIKRTTSWREAALAADRFNTQANQGQMPTQGTGGAVAYSSLSEWNDAFYAAVRRGIDPSKTDGHMDEFPLDAVQNINSLEVLEEARGILTQAQPARGSRKGHPTTPAKIAIDRRIAELKSAELESETDVEPTIVTAEEQGGPAATSAEILAAHGLDVSTRESAKSGKTYWSVTGNTYQHKDLLTELGAAKPIRIKGKWTRSFFDGDPTQKIAAALAGDGPPVRPGRGTEQPADRRDGEENVARLAAREREDARADESGVEGDIGELVSAETRSLIRRGERFGVPADVTAEQIEDVALGVQAFQRERPLFIIAHEAGSGKTFILGGLIRELRARGVERSIFVTMNTDLIDQLKRDLADYGLEGVEFYTYAKMPADAEGAAVIFDEAHNVKNPASKRGGRAASLMAQSRFAVFSSATPFENPVQAVYLGPTGIFDKLGGHTEWAKMYGASVRRSRSLVATPSGMQYEEIETPYWIDSKEAAGHAKLAREWIVKQGVLTQREKKLDPAMVTTTFRRVAGDPELMDTLQRATDAYESAKNEWRGPDGKPTDATQFGIIAMNQVGVTKRILEAAKAREGAARARELLEQGYRVAIFVETKADRWIGRYRKSRAKQSDPTYTYPQIKRMMDEWRREREMARGYRRAGDTGDASAYDKAPFSDAIETIARHMHERGVLYEMPSVPEVLTEELGRKNVTFYTGSQTAAKGQENKDRWLAGEGPRVLVLTMAKGGTGLSLHDTEGDQPTAQVNINLPWTASAVKQVSGRVARYGIASPAEIEWIFAEDFPFESVLANRVGGRMRSMGASVQGIDVQAAEALSEFDFEQGYDASSMTMAAEGQVVARASLEQGDTPAQTADELYRQAEALESGRRQGKARGTDTSGDYFATPFPLAVLMHRIAGVGQGDRLRVLEPSAGDGNLLRLVPDGNRMLAVELRASLLDQVRKDAHRVGGDFLEVTPEEISKGLGGKPDVVLMNPPFGRSNGYGMEHVYRAFDLMADGGRLVAVLGEHPFFGSDKKSQAFRDWLEDTGATTVKLPPETFKNSGTTVSTRLLVIDKVPDNAGVDEMNLEDVGELRDVEDVVPAPSRGVTRKETREDIESALPEDTGSLMMLAEDLGVTMPAAVTTDQVRAAIMDAVPSNEVMQTALRASADQRGATSQRLRDFADRIEREAKERIARRSIPRGGDTGASTIPGDLVDYVIVGTAKVLRGAATFADWASEMRADFGDSVEPRLREIYDLSREEAGRASKFAELVEQARDERDGSRTLGRPDLANPVRDEEARRVVDAVDAAREAREEPVPQKDSVVGEEAQARLDEDYEGEKRRLVNAARMGEPPRDAVDVIVAKRIVEREAISALQTGDSEALTAAMVVTEAYRDQGTEQGRAFRARRDEFESPAERAAHFVTMAMVSPTASARRELEKQKELLQKASPKERQSILGKIAEILTREASTSEKIVHNLRKQGIEPSQITDENMHDPVFASKVMRAISTARAHKSDMLFEFWIAGLLSAPTTHMANAIGNSTFGLWQLIGQRFIQAAIGKVPGLSKDAPQFREFVDMAAVVGPALSMAARNMVLSFGTELPILAREMELEGGEPTGIGSKLEQDTQRAKLPGTAGRVIRTPLRALQAADEFYKTFYAMLHLSALANRRARQQGLKGEDKRSYVVSEMADLASDTWSEAYEFATELTFQNEQQGITKAILDGAITARKHIPLARWVALTFVTFPVASLRAGFRKTPVISAVTFVRLLREGAIRMNLTKRVPTYTVQRFRDDLADNVVAWGIVLMLMSWLMDDEDEFGPRITGTRAADYGELSNEYKTAPPMSFRIGHTFYSYSRIEPLGIPLAMGVDLLKSAMAETDGNKFLELLETAAGSFKRVINDKTFLRGISEIANVVDMTARGHGTKAVATWSSNFAASWVPNIVRSASRATDPYIRDHTIRVPEDESEIEAGLRRALHLALPIAANSPPPRVDLWGRPISARQLGGPASDVAYRMISPVRRTNVSSAHQLDHYIRAYNTQVAETVEDEFWPKLPDNRITRQGRTFTMDARRYNEYLKESGSKARRLLEARLESGTLNPEQPSEVGMNIIREALRVSRRHYADRFVAQEIARRREQNRETTERNGAGREPAVR